MRARHLADGAVLAGFPDLDAAAANRVARALARAIGCDDRVLDAIPAARTLLVLFDPGRLLHGDLEDLLREEPPEVRDAPRTVHVPACYGGEAGPDLDDLARAANLAPRDLARLHAAADHEVAFLGFAPGFPYLTGAPPALSVPRLASPRVRVPARSLAVADGYTGIYPERLPGGWRLIGRVALDLFDPGGDPPSLLRPGDRVVFDPIDAKGLARFESRAPPAPATPRNPALRVLDPGLTTSVQSGPRHGLGAYGVGAGGAMDLPALAAANEAVGNPPFSGALEITLAGPRLELLADASFALAGAPLETRWNGTLLEGRGPWRGAAGDHLELGPIREGVRAYLALAGGLEPPPRGTAPRPLRAQEIVGHAEGPAPHPFAPPRARPRPADGVLALRALEGPQWDFFTDTGRATFFSGKYRMIPASDRRGLRLDGPRIELARPSDIAPEGTAPGSVQVPGNGLPIVLGPDRPVTGGYAKIATVVSADLPLLAQARPGTIIRFAPATLEEALAARRAAT